MKRHGFTLIELLCVMGVVTVLGMVGASAVLAQRTQALSTQCVANLRQWGVALQLYMQDNDGYLPRRGQGVQPVFRIERPEDWFNCLPPYLGMTSYYDLYQAGRPPKARTRSVFVCPAAADSGAHPHFICYGMNMYVSRWDQPERTKLTRYTDPSTIAFLADSPGGYASTVPSASGYSVQARHGGRANVAFLDGHVQSFSGAYLGCGNGEKLQPDVRWNPGIPGDTWAPNL